MTPAQVQQMDKETEALSIKQVDELRQLNLSPQAMMQISKAAEYVYMALHNFQKPIRELIVRQAEEVSSAADAFIANIK